MKKRLLVFGLFIGLIGIIAVLFLMSNWRVKERILQYKFDKTNSQKRITKENEIRSVLSNFKQLSYQELDSEYKTFTKSNQDKYEKMLIDKTYYQLSRNDFFRYIVDDIRINEFLPKDKYYKDCLSDKTKTYYWLMDKKLLEKLLALQNLLEEKGYNKRGFSITNGHRHPKDNERVGGAKLSRHIKGEALDIRINDIDKSGKFEKRDKEIVLDLLEKEIIKSTGGIGKYPGTRAVHFDVRGYKARWDSY